MARKRGTVERIVVTELIRSRNKNIIRVCKEEFGYNAGRIYDIIANIKRGRSAEDIELRAILQKLEK